MKQEVLQQRFLKRDQEVAKEIKKLPKRPREERNSLSSQKIEKIQEYGQQSLRQPHTSLDFKKKFI